MDKRVRAATFRERLSAAMVHEDMNRSALARAAGADRSTLSQLLNADETRLPNAQLVAECAGALGVSTDWLLGLTDRPERPGDLVAASMRISAAARTSVDEQLLEWHREAEGHKIRHAPAALPDLLKTEAMLKWEYDSFLEKTPDQAIGATVDRLDWLRSGTSDYEIAFPLHEIETFARGEGYYRDVPADVRDEQLEAFCRYSRDMYPSLRLFLFDARKLFSAPISVFGPQLAVVYIGRFYLAFRSGDRIRSMIQHFDWLIRECTINASQAPKYLEKIQAESRG
ncbi:MAG: helix-turn-helix domain-containing protein [Pikeienuella sp.]